MSATKIATVVGATGYQGSAVVSALQQNGGYHIRAITRHPKSEPAISLASQGVEIVQADISDRSSLLTSFAGSHLIFAVTNFTELIATHGIEKGIELEGQYALNIARAVAATPSLEHFIWSTMPQSKKISDGNVVVPHFESKGLVNDFVHGHPTLLAKTTFLWVGWYDSNVALPLAMPMPLRGSEKYFVMGNWPAETPIPLIGDVKRNISPFISAILEQPERTRNGTFVFATTGTMTFEQWIQLWGKVHGKTVSYVKIDTPTYLSLWPGWAHVVNKDMEYFSRIPFDRAWSDPTAHVLQASELGIDNQCFVSSEESLKAYALT